MQKVLNLIPKTFAGKTVLFCAFFLLIYLFGNGMPTKIISWDVYGYYLYLPQAIIHGDLGVENFDTVTSALDSTVESGTFYQATQADTGNWIIKYPMGISIFYLPFFLLGLLVSWIGGYPLDGFSLPSEHAMTIGSFFYMLVGLRLVWKIITHFFSDIISGVTILLLVFGTNYYQIHTGSHCMPHVYLFTGYAALIWLTIRWYETKKLKDAIGIGLIIGLLTISRPTEIMAVLIPIFFGITSIEHFFQRLGRFFKWYKHILFAGLAIFIMILPQLIYWKVYAGQWFYNSYNNPGEGLDIGSPNLFEFLFSYRKGWLMYTPVMLFALLGLVRARKSTQSWFWSSAIFTICYIYVSSCWSSWWYATSFSQRTMVQVYPVLVLPIAFLLDSVKNKIGKRSIVFSFGMLLVILNMFQTWQYDQGIIDSSRMTKKYYWKVFGAQTVPEGASKYLLVDRSTTVNEYINDFSDYYVHSSYQLIENNGAFRGISQFDSNKTVSILPGGPSPKFEMAFSDLTIKDHAWLLISGKARVNVGSSLDQIMVTSTFAHDGLAYKYHNEPLRSYIIESDKDYEQFYLMYLTPEVRSSSDPFQFYLINNSEQDTLVLFDVRVDVYQRSGMYE